MRHDVKRRREEAKAWRELQRTYRISGRDALLEVTNYGRSAVAIVWNASRRMFEVRVARGFVVRPEHLPTRTMEREHFFEALSKARQHASELAHAVESEAGHLVIGAIQRRGSGWNEPRTYRAGTVRVAAGRVVFTPDGEPLEQGERVQDLFAFEGTLSQAKRFAARRTRIELEGHRRAESAKEALGDRINPNDIYDVSALRAILARAGGAR
jgi:hypothetical protein